MDWDDESLPSSFLEDEIDDIHTINTHYHPDAEQMTQISILLDWYGICAHTYTKDDLIRELISVFNEITKILYLTNREVKMVYRYYRYLYGTLSETQQFYTTDEIIFCTKILETMINILINKFRLNSNSNLQ